MIFKNLLQKHKQIIFYGIFGILTTLVNISAYWVLAHIFRLGTVFSTVIAWVLAVLFAFITNRKWVFNSVSKGKKEITQELLAFFTCRIATGILDIACMYVFAVRIPLNDIFVKIFSNLLVIILNYIASKLLIFKSKTKTR